ncbi:hypothetical protein C8R46DRAFT_1044823 [Mycena filopes]|nr:hypothetical protein C8R46DRAFT_1044823 [Mycena filopes]
MLSALTAPDEDVEALRRELQVARQEIGFLQAILNQGQSCRRTTSSIDHLRAELMAEIFLFFSALNSPLLLCWVCHDWRVIATNLTSLWLRPTFTLGPAFFPTHPTANYPDLRVDQFLGQMRRWLDRVHTSHCVSLSILRAGHAYRWKEIPLLETLVLPYANCFRSLEIDASQGQLAHLLDAGLPFPNLEILSLRLPFLDLAGWLPRRGLPNAAYPTTPSLHRLVIRSAKVISERHPITSAFFSCFPWGQIVSLNMEDVSLDFWMWQKLMHQCSSLRFGEFTLRKCAPTSDHQSSTMTHLTSLLVKFATQIDVGVFEGLTFPAMEKLHITGYASLRGKRNLVAWAQQHGGALRHLTLEMNIADDTSLFDLLPHLLRVEVLRLYLDFRISSVLAKTIIGAIERGNLKSLKALALCSNGVVKRYKTTRPVMFDICIEALISAAEAWVAVSGNPPNQELRILAEGEILSELKTRLRTVAGIRTVLSPKGGPALHIHHRSSREAQGKVERAGVECLE